MPVTTRTGDYSPSPPSSPLPSSPPEYIGDLDQGQRTQKAIEWKKKHPEEGETAISRIFDVPRTTIYSATKRGHKGQWGGQNRVLDDGETVRIRQFIVRCLEYQVWPSPPFVYAAVASLKAKQNKPAPSHSWFRSWWKENGFHQIITKPIAAIRYTSQDSEMISNWFQGYRRVIFHYKFKKSQIYNFDEAGFRVRCPRGHRLIVPEHIKEVYILSTLYSITNSIIVLLYFSRESKILDYYRSYLR